jgi:DNA (cytosine-5)-methyltransferase 1
MFNTLSLMNKYHFIDLFAGAGGLSEGFIRAGFNPIAHVEMNKDACDSLRTRTAFHWLKENNRVDEYYDYLKNIISRDELWAKVPNHLIKSVINTEISEETFSVGRFA